MPSENLIFTTRPSAKSTGMPAFERPPEVQSGSHEPPAPLESSAYRELSSLSQAQLLFIPPGIENTLDADPYDEKPACSPQSMALETQFPWLPACQGEAGLDSAHMNYVGAGKIKKSVWDLIKAKRAKPAVAQSATPLSEERSLPELLQDLNSGVWKHGKMGRPRDAADWEALDAIRERAIHPALKHVAIDIAQATPGLRRPSIHWIRVSDGRDFLATAQFHVDPSHGSSVLLRLFDPTGKKLLSEVQRSLPHNEAAAASEIRTSLEAAKATLEKFISHSRATQIGQSGLKGRPERQFPHDLDDDVFNATH